MELVGWEIAVGARCPDGRDMHSIIFNLFQRPRLDCLAGSMLFRDQLESGEKPSAAIQHAKRKNYTSPSAPSVLFTIIQDDACWSAFAAGSAELRTHSSSVKCAADHSGCL